jgi:hypothetical protein
VTAARYVVLRCNGPECGNETHHPFSDSMTVTELRRARAEDGWHARPGGRDICPNCWKEGHR